MPNETTPVATFNAQQQVQILHQVRGLKMSILLQKEALSPEATAWIITELADLVNTIAPVQDGAGV
jgi:hypothetical protein